MSEYFQLGHLKLPKTHEFANLTGYALGKWGISLSVMHFEAERNNGKGHYEVGIICPLLKESRDFTFISDVDIWFDSVIRRLNLLREEQKEFDKILG